MCWEFKERFSFFASRYVLWGGNQVVFVSGIGGACVFYSIRLLKGSLKSGIFFFFFLRIFPPSVRGSGSHSNPPPSPAPLKMSGLDFVLSWTLLVRIFRTTPCAYFWPWLLPVGWGRSPRRVDSWQKMWWERACVWGEMGCQALGVLWSSLPRHCDYLHILEKKIRPNFSKEWLFFLQPWFAHSFRFWPGLFSLMVVNRMARLSQ